MVTRERNWDQPFLIGNIACTGEKKIHVQKRSTGDNTKSGSKKAG